MGNSIKNYVRTYRKRSNLSQVELAVLLGLQGGQAVSRYEWGTRSPSTRNLLAIALLFDVQPHEIFPSLVKEVETLLITRAATLNDALTSAPIDRQTVRENPHNPTDRILERKRAFLTAMIERIATRDH